MSHPLSQRFTGYVYTGIGHWFAWGQDGRSTEPGILAGRRWSPIDEPTSADSWRVLGVLSERIDLHPHKNEVKQHDIV